MELNLVKNSVNQVEKGTVIYNKDEVINSVSIVLKGRVLAVGDGSKVLLGSGSFLGISDFYAGRLLNSYIAYDDVTFYCFSLSKTDELDAAFMSNKDYKGLAVQSLIRNINDLYGIYKQLNIRAIKLYDFISSTYENYLELATKLGYPSKTIPLLEDLSPYKSDFIVDEKKLLYYKDLAKVPIDLLKNLCGVGNFITPYFIEDMSNYIIEIQEECMDISNYIVELFYTLISREESCLFKNYASLTISIEEAGGYSKDIISVIDTIIDQINITETLFEEKVGQSITVDRERMEEIYYMLLSKSSNRKEHMQSNFSFTQDEMDEVNKSLAGSFETIMSYSNMEKGKQEEFKQSIQNYVNLRDKQSLDDNARAIRRLISDQFYELYKVIFFKAYKDATLPKSVDLFLKYGFIDERFLSKEQLRELYYLEDLVNENDFCPVYNIKDWLIQIYEGKKEPSKNEFDLDYYEMLREKRKRGELSEADEKVQKENVKEKVIYEISNMFRYNNRLVSGALSSFIPILHGDNMIQNIKRLYVDSNKVNTAIAELIEIDYSLFYREKMFVDNEKGIAKEYIMEEIFPDIILLPTVGMNGVMWQEITGKRKSSRGRFMLPSFTDASVKDIIIKLCGRFRWELCRSIQGSAWNNIKYKSLTSEYGDYLQFYRKNRDLSEEVKEKLKAQIQKGKNNYREVFVIDYEAWIKGESNGSLRLNRVAREILATYCPFSRTIRERIGGQPLFQDAYQRFQRNTIKKVKEVELRYRALEKEGVKLPKELTDTLSYYKDL